MVWRILLLSNFSFGRIFLLNFMLLWRILNLFGYELIKILRVESGRKKKRRGGGFVFVIDKKNFSIKLCFEGLR